MRVFVEGVGLAGPGLDGWARSRPILAGDLPWRDGPTPIAASDLLPAAERRRTGVPVRLALAVGREALVQAERDATSTATVFTSSGGDCDNVHQICEALAAPGREVSPTRFHNAVHNAAAGYWGIATRSHEMSTSLCAYDASFAVGLLEAGGQAVVDGYCVALIAYDQPYPDPLNAVRPIRASFGVALVLTPGRTERAIAALEVAYSPQRADATRMEGEGLEVLRAGVPAARALSLLALLARGVGGTVLLEHVEDAHVRVEVIPCG
jgi:hypothetical protein